MATNNVEKSRSLIVFCVAALLCAFGGNAYSSSHIETAVGPDKQNALGINIASPLDWEEDRLYADIVRMSRDFSNGSSPAPVDADGWPTSDFSFYAWAGIGKMHGTYTLTFKGQARVTANPVGNISVTYDADSNTSSGTFRFKNSSTSSLNLSFNNTRRSAAAASGSGVTAIKLMRPIAPGASQSYPPTTLFNSPIKALIAKFGVVRYMDFLATNGNVQANWSERPLPSWPSFQRKVHSGGYGWQGIGGPLEHVILLANETGKDAWINIPVRANDAYILNVARLFAYGSDGVNPYTSPQAKPLYPPLNANLKLYVEYSNELWNSAGPFPQFGDNCQAASDELVSTAGKSALNWDGLWNKKTFRPGSWDNNWQMCWRRPAKRSVEISNMFRSVFGDAAMMTRVRPLLMTQLGYTGGMLLEQAKLLLNYYNNMAGNFVATPHPPNYYFYGAGGSGYYNPANSVATLDALFADKGMTPAGFAPALQEDAKLVAAMGLKRVAYEGGPSLDKLGGPRDEIAPLAIADPRMTAAMIDMHNAWSSNGGELFVYYRATGDYQWGFTQDAYNLATPKLLAIDALNTAGRAPLTLGTQAPGSIGGNAADACSRGWSCSPIPRHDFFTADGSKIIWASYTFRSSAAAPWKVKLELANASGNASVAVYVDGVLAGTLSASGATLSFNAGTVGAGLHAVIVRAAAGSFAVKSVAVALN